MLKKNNTPIEDVMKAVAKENGFTYVPPEKRTPKRLVFEKDSSGNIVVSLKDKTSDKKGTIASVNKHAGVAASSVLKSPVKFAYKRKRKSGTRKANRKSSSSVKNYG